jgi:DNA invertase Pin-like site-specific DNA recombinase
MRAMSKITSEHFARAAFVYVRQSTAYQVVNNLESQRRQYGLVERARHLGWDDVQLVDDDLGRSGGGTARPGFEKLLAAICEGRVGAVVSLEASRLARNGRDWHTLLEFCGLVGTLIVDEEAIYDPRSPNDRLLLGMKGTMSEMELSVFRQRSVEAMRQKARRGELHLTVAVGYVKTDDNRIEKDPDRRVQDGIALVFHKFAELHSIRQVLLWFRQENVPVPAIVQGRGKGQIEWKAPVYHTLYHVLTNPVYAGSYAYGRRRTSVTIAGGRKRILRDNLRRNWKEWEVLIHDHHAGYITWVEFERNQHLIADNANGKSYMGRGSIRRGEALLPGLFRCARCGRRLHIQYTGKGGNTQRYACKGTFSINAVSNCIGFAGCGSTASSPRRLWAACSRLGSRRRWPRWKPIRSNSAISVSRSRTRFSKPNTRLPGRAGNMTSWTLTIVWLLVNWSDAGMRNWFNCATWRSNAKASIKRSRRQRSQPKTVRG